MVVVERRRPLGKWRSKSFLKITGTRLLIGTVLTLQAVVIILQVVLGQVFTTVGFENSTTDGSDAAVLSDANVWRANSQERQLQHDTRNHILLLHSSTSTHNQQEVTCVAWRATDDCSPYGPRRSHKALSFFADTDLSCDDYVPTYGSGYCELETTSSSSSSTSTAKSKTTTLYAFHQSCDHQGRIGPLPIWKRYMPVFKCNQAVQFLNYQHRARHYQPAKPLPISTSPDGNANKPTRGIVIQIYPSALPSVYAIIKMLREVQHSELAIELWHVQGEFPKHQPANQNPIVQHLLQTYNNIYLRLIAESDIISSSKNANYMSKIHTIAYSQFDQVLFLDSDNFPFRDPTYLFDNLNDLNKHNNNKNEKSSTVSAIFWKDFWSPQRHDYVMTNTSVVWELLGISNGATTATTSPNAREEMEMESGQMVIDRRYSKEALQVSLFFAQTFSEWFEPLVLVWGDKDLFRLAWYMTETPFHYIQQPPSLAGQDVIMKWFSFDVVCGITMVQHDLRGEPIFFHRNIAKLSTKADLFKVWEKGAKFVGTNADTQYDIEGSRSLYRMHGCYHPKAHVRQYFEEIDYRGTGVEAFEDEILKFAREGIEVLNSR